MFLSENPGFDILFGFETHVAFDIDLNPESLAIKTVLVSRLMALHGFESLKEIFVGPSPCVVTVVVGGGVYCTVVVGGGVYGTVVVGGGVYCTVCNT